MKDRQEQLLFAGVLVLVGLLTWMRLSEGYRRLPVPSPQKLAAAELDLPALLRRGAPTELGPASTTRDRPLVAPPRELLPLDPLTLPEPPLPLLSVRRPAVEPSLQGPFARKYRVRPEDLGALELSDDVSGTPGGAVGEAAVGALGGVAAALSAAASSVDTGTLGETVLEERFDWVVRTGASRRLYGRILNDDPHGLKSRPDEALQFQQVSERTGGPLGLPFTLERDDVERFDLAATFENAYRFRTRQLGSGPGSASTRRNYASELLAAWPDEPQALEFALTEARLALTAAPRDAVSARLLARIQRRAHDLEGELAVYRKAVADGYADAPLLAGYALRVHEQGLTERAWELLAEGRRVSRAAAESSYVEGLLLMAEGRHAEALPRLQEAASLGVAEPFTEHEAVLALGAALIAAGNPGDAAREAQRLLLDDPTDTGALRLEAAAAAADDDLDTAWAALQAALAADGDDARLLYDAGVVAWRRGDGGGALRLFERARDVDPFRAVTPTLALGFLHEDAGRPEQARDLYAAALELDPGDPEALYRLGRIQRLDGDPAGAVNTLRKALRLAGPDVLLLSELARASMDRGRFENAGRYLREAERLEPDNEEVQWGLGLAALYAGDGFAAREHLERAVSLGAAGAHVGLGVGAYRRGDEEAALDHFDEAVKAYAGKGDDPQALYAVEQSERVRDNLAKRQWLDRFGRSTLQRGWLEHQWDGSPRVFLDSATLHIEGRMEKPRDDERPGISRPVEGKGYFAAQAELVAGEGGRDMRYGLTLVHRQLRGTRGRLPKARLEIWVDTDGRVRTSVLDSFESVLRDAEELPGVRVSPGTPVTLGVELLDASKGTCVFTLDGRTVGDPLDLKTLRDFNQFFDLEIWAEASPGGQASAQVSLVRIVQAP